MLETAETFGNVDRYRLIMNNVQLFGDFILDVCPTILLHASGVTGNEEGHVAEVPQIEPKNDEENRLLALVKSKRRNCEQFWNSLTLVLYA